MRVGRDDRSSKNERRNGEDWTIVCCFGMSVGEMIAEYSAEVGKIETQVQCSELQVEEGDSSGEPASGRVEKR